VNHVQYRTPSGGLVLDFTIDDQVEHVRATVRAIHRYTTSSRKPGWVSDDTVWSRSVPRKKCLLCGGWCHGETPAGRQAPHSDDKGHIVNCVGGIISNWP